MQENRLYQQIRVGLHHTHSKQIIEQHENIEIKLFIGTRHVIAFCIGQNRRFSELMLSESGGRHMWGQNYKI